MRIVLTTESYLPYLSGVTVSVDALARGLGAAGHQVLVVAPEPASGAKIGPIGSPGPAPRHAWLPSYQPALIAPPHYRMPWPHPMPGALREARAFRPDIVHAHSPFVTGLLARRLAGDTGVPLIFTHHTRFGDYAHYLGPLARPGRAVTHAYLHGFWRGCAAIVAPSSDLAEAIRAEIGPGPGPAVHVIPTGVDVAGILEGRPVDPRPATGWPAESVVVASLGRLAPEKSPGVLLDALAKAAARVPELRAVIVGGGPSERDVEERAAQPPLAGRIVLTGALPRPEALARIAGADLFLFASRTETQGLVLAEALSAGLPSIAVDGPGVRDSVRDGIDGLIVPAGPEPSLVERLADAVASLAVDGDRRSAMAARARADAERFSEERRVAETEAVYRSFAARSE
ncbi:MAG: glycosyltransferase [Chloroflexota bacterium]|nr:glycosyltransferase [Chloroflexota bacterium]